MEKKMNFGMNAAEVYEAPVCEVLELQTEGVLCSSGDDGDLGDDGFHEEDEITHHFMMDEEDY